MGQLAHLPTAVNKTGIIFKQKKTIFVLDMFARMDEKNNQL